MDRLKDKVTLVTGGALGLGRAMALLMAREGACVVVTDMRDADGANVVIEIEKAGGAGHFFHHDVSKEEEWVNAVDGAVKIFGRLDVVVNNAGIAIHGNAEDVSLADWRKLMSINLDGVFLGVKYRISAMKAGKHGGSIIKLSSIEGLIGDPDLAAYCSSKGGVRLLTKSAALYCAKSGTGIRVNSVHPGYISTPMVQNAERSAVKSADCLASSRPSGRTRRYRLGGGLSRFRRIQIHDRRRAGDRRRLHGAMRISAAARNAVRVAAFAERIHRHTSDAWIYYEDASQACWNDNCDPRIGALPGAGLPAI